jgi:hypothetical protein
MAQAPFEEEGGMILFVVLSEEQEVVDERVD